MEKYSCCDYPLVIKKHVGHITISVPDLGITLIEDLAVTKTFDQASALKIGNLVLKAWLKTQKLLDEKSKSKKPVERPSNIKGSLDLATRDLSPSQFAKFVGVSSDTITRDCAKGLILCRRTTGGHYKIPASEIALYKEYMKNHVKHAHEPWSKSALNNLRDSR